MSDPAYTVVGFPRSRTLRVLWLLEEMGEPYTLNPAPPRSAAVRALNPSGKIPVLQTLEGPLTDSVAIMTYLADKHGAFTHPAGSLARGRQDAITQYIVAEVDAALWLYAKHSFVLPEDWRVPEVKPTAGKEFARALQHLAEVKGDAPYLAGDAPTIPDFILSHCAGWGLGIKFELPGGAMDDYLKAMRKRPAMARVSALVEEHAGRSGG